MQATTPQSINRLLFLSSDREPWTMVPDISNNLPIAQIRQKDFAYLAKAVIAVFECDNDYQGTSDKQ